MTTRRFPCCAYALRPFQWRRAFLAVACCSGRSSLAHPVFAPFDETQFAPITRFGPLIALTPMTTGLTAPNKGVAAPGDREHLYVVDQIGIVWKVNIADGAKSVFLDVRARLVPLGFLRTRHLR